MINAIKNLIKYGRCSGASDDSGQYPIQQFEYQGKAADVFVAMPYGLSANIPIGTLAVILNVNANEQNRVALPTSAKERVKDLAVGEVVFFHPVTKSKVHFKNNGDVDVTSATKVNVTAPTATFSGDVTIAGDLTVTGDTALGATVDSDGTAIGSTHVHSGITSGGSNSGPPV